MATLGNLLWFILGGGLFMALAWCFYGVVFGVTIIGIPFAVAAFRITGFAAFPFGKQLVDARAMGQERVTGTGLANFLWAILAGLWLMIAHVLVGIACCITIIGIPFGLAHFKLAGVSIAPLGKRTVPNRVAEQIRMNAAADGFPR